MADLKLMEKLKTGLVAWLVVGGTALGLDALKLKGTTLSGLVATVQADPLMTIVGMVVSVLIVGFVLGYIQDKM